MDTQFFLPVLSHFQNGNVWTASAGQLRYQLSPQEETLKGELWEGPFGYDSSKVEVTETFPLTEEGLVSLRAWIETWTITFGARPPKTLAQTLAEREGKEETT